MAQFPLNPIPGIIPDPKSVDFPHFPAVCYICSLVLCCLLTCAMLLRTLGMHRWGQVPFLKFPKFRMFPIFPMLPMSLSPFPLSLFPFPTSPAPFPMSPILFLMSPSPFPMFPGFFQVQPAGSVPGGRAGRVFPGPHLAPFPGSRGLLDRLLQLPGGLRLPG